MTPVGNIEQRAAEWLLRSEEPDWSVADAAALNAWLAESDAHKAAYWRLEQGWRQADRLAALHEASVFGEGHRTRRWLWPIAASIALMLGVGAYQWPSSTPAPAPLEVTQIATEVGARKLVKLEDGSQIDMNTGSAIRTAVSAETRIVWLDQGEAYFDIAKRMGQKFIVHAGPKTITVLGTKFSVRRDGNKVSVSVAEGRVRIDDSEATGAGRSTVIEAGDVAITRGASTLVTANATEKVESTLAWRDGMLSFDQRTLAEAAAEFNRYNAKKLEITDPEAASIRIGGTFRSDNVDAFVRLLRDAYGLKIVDDGEKVKISS